MMEIVPVRPAHLEALHAIYLAQVAGAPHCRFAPDFVCFRDEIMGGREKPAKLFDKPRSSQTFVAEVSGVAQGFATLVTYGGGDEAHDHGKEKQAITGLFFADEAAGEALIHLCEAQAAFDELSIFPDMQGFTPMHSYNAGWDGLSDRVPRVAQLLARHGYTPYARELHLVAPLWGAPALPSQHLDASLPAPLEIRAKDWPGEGEAEARVFDATDGETRAGFCLYCLLSQISDEPEARCVGYVVDLYVEEAYRRRGIGRALMVSAMNEMVAQGCTECWLTTSAKNWAAQRLYYTLNFETVDCSVSFRKQIGR